MNKKQLQARAKELGGALRGGFNFERLTGDTNRATSSQRHRGAVRRFTSIATVNRCS